jgi:hypothetical protein
MKKSHLHVDKVPEQGQFFADSILTSLFFSSASSRRSSVRSGAAIPSPVVIAAAEQSDNELDLSLASSLPKVSTFKRTPTPPRPTLSAQRAFIGRYSTTRSNGTNF